MNLIYGSYDAILVILSFTIAVIASYTALDLAARVTPASSRRSRLAWILGGAISMGSGIWSMHFIAMLAFRLPIPVNYDVPLTLLSWVVAIVASGFALLLSSRPKLNSSVMLVGSVVMGLAIASMHYLGMAAVRVPVAMHYQLHLVVLSVAIAIGASGAALWMAFRFRYSSTVSFDWLKLGSAFIMGTGISGMHYTGMWATCFVQKVNSERIEIEGVDNSWLAIEVGIGTLIILIGTLLTSLFDRKYASQLVREQALQESEKRFRSTIETMPVGVLLLNAKGKIILINEVGRNLLAIPENEIEAKSVFDLNWQLLDEDGKVVPEQKHFLKQMLANHQPLHNSVVSIPASATQTKLWLLLNVDPHFNDDGKIERVVCTFSNISDRKLAEIALKQQLKRERLVNSIQERIRSSLNLEEVLTTTVEEVRQFLSTDRTLIYRFQPDWSGMAIVESVGDGWMATKGIDILDNCFLEKFIPLYQQGRVRAIENIYAANLSTCHVNLLAKFQVKANLVVPILESHSDSQNSIQNRLWGLLIAHHCQNCRNWESSEIDSLKQIAVQLAIAIQQCTLFEQAKTEITERRKAEIALIESAERERAIAQVIQRIRQTLDLETIFTATTQELRQVIKCDRVLVYRFQPDWSGELVAESVGKGWISAIQEQTHNPYFTAISTESDRCIIKSLNNQNHVEIKDTYLQETQGGIYSQGQNYLAIENIYQAGFNDCYIHLLEQFQAKAYLIVPIFSGHKFWGLLAIYQNSDFRRWQQTEIKVAIQIGNQLGVALQQAELLEQTQRQSAALQQAVIAADTANRAKSEFLASMSHELRTPLNAILGFTQIMARDSSLKNQQQEYLGIINRAGEHLLSLINDILEMSKIEAGRTTLNETSFDLIWMLDSLENMFRLKCESKGLQLIFEGTTDTIPRYVKTDEGKLRQVLINILGNAIKFTEYGKVTLRVKSVCSEDLRFQNVKNEELNPNFNTNYLLFEVEDTGPGISETEIENLFEPFRQTEIGRKSQEGTGLGLPISKKFVQLMGGEITVSSKVRVGTTFAFSIQFNRVVPNEITVRTRKNIIELANREIEYRILVVDDLPESRLLLTALFTSIGFQVREAENGLEAISLWESWQPHLICMDMRMPVMNGYEATQYIKGTPQGQKTVIIALTASAFEQDKKMFLDSGCDDFVRKPFQEEELLEKMGKYLDIQYIYEEATKDNSEIRSEGSNDSFTVFQLTPESLKVMPIEWAIEVRNAALQCSDDTILELLKQIPPENSSIADALFKLANNFQFEVIEKLFDRTVN